MCSNRVCEYCEFPLTGRQRRFCSRRCNADFSFRSNGRGSPVAVVVGQKFGPWVILSAERKDCGRSGYAGFYVACSYCGCTRVLGHHVLAECDFKKRTRCQKCKEPLLNSQYRLNTHGIKTCRRCMVAKPALQFEQNINKKDGLWHHCRRCVRDEYLRGAYGITIDNYEDLLENQNFRCAICGVPETEVRNSLLNVDHSHSTGQVRGLLCQSCNMALGQFQDDPSILFRAASYLNASLQTIPNEVVSNE